MARAQDLIGHTIIKEALSFRPSEAGFKNPTVLSCGGIYIPYRGERQTLIYHILNTPSDKEPVKIITGARPRNALHEVLLKESLN